MISGATVYQAFAATAARWPERPMLCITPSTARAYGGGEDADGGLIGDVVEQVGHLAAELLYDVPSFLLLFFSRGVACHDVCARSAQC